MRRAGARWRHFYVVVHRTSYYLVVGDTSTLLYVPSTQYLPWVELCYDGR